MKILAIETTGPRASVALMDGRDGSLSERRAEEEMNHLKGLVNLVGELLAERKLSMGDIDCIAASEGPGSFTGIRIGLSTARALAQVKEIQTIGVPTLESFVYHAPGHRGAVCPVFDARRAQVYGGAFFLSASGGPEALVEGAARAPEDLLRALEEIDWEAREGLERRLLFFGDGISVYGALIREWAEGRKELRIAFAPEADRAQRASSVAKLALHMKKNGQSKPFSDLLPVYMRKAEAERRLEEAEGSKL
jgi:tRNA threonylcarbamoyladenosine biosynthesis protein TsaB